jgi:hypothetical protein
MARLRQSFTRVALQSIQGLGVSKPEYEVVWVKGVIVDHILVVVQVAASVITSRLVRRVREIMGCRRVKSIGD